jgi:hypothetical protein
LNEALIINGYKEDYLDGDYDDNGVDNNCLYGVRMFWVCNEFVCVPASYQENER